jgi:hypothetical protein
VAAHNTSPAIRLVQLGVVLTAPVRVVHLLHAEPLWTPTVIAALAVNAAHATTPADTTAHEGAPTVATVVAAFNALHEPQAAGVALRQAHSKKMLKRLRRIQNPPVVEVLNSLVRRAKPSQSSLFLSLDEGSKDFRLYAQLIVNTWLTSLYEVCRDTIRRTGAGANEFGNSRQGCAVRDF